MEVDYSSSNLISLQAVSVKFDFRAVVVSS